MEAVCSCLDRRHRAVGQCSSCLFLVIGSSQRGGPSTARARPMCPQDCKALSFPHLCPKNVLLALRSGFIATSRGHCERPPAAYWLASSSLGLRRRRLPHRTECLWQGGVEVQSTETGAGVHGRLCFVGTSPSQLPWEVVNKDGTQFSNSY